MLLRFVNANVITIIIYCSYVVKYDYNYYSVFVVYYGQFAVVWKVGRGAGEVDQCCARFSIGHGDGIWAGQVHCVGVKAGLCEGIVLPYGTQQVL